MSPTSLYERERIFNKDGPTNVPRFGICFSGGGNRSAAFSIGVLRALHELDLLSKVDVVSAVSGGSYALSWLLMQPYYHRSSLEDPRGALGQVQEEMFDLNGPFQRYLATNTKPLGARNWFSLLVQAAIMLPVDLTLFNMLRILSFPLTTGSISTKVANLLNAQSFARKSYREGIQRTYQVFPTLEKKAPFEKLNHSFLERSIIAAEHLDLTRNDVVPVSFPDMRAFAQRAGLPSFVFNTTVRPPRPNEDVPLGHRIFELGPMGFGSDSCGYLTWDDTEGFGWEPGKPVENNWKFGQDVSDRISPYATLRNFNVAPAISGAALSGTNIEQSNVRLLLRLLNMGLEYVIPSPGDRSRVIRLSDGGHSENLGAYALLRRQCRTILIVDAEHDPSYSFSSYRKLKQAAQQELSVEIDIPGLDEILCGSNTFATEAPVFRGTLAYDAQHKSEVYYLKLSMHEDLLHDQAEFITPYAEKHLAFPQEPTSDQYFQSAQFEAYRALGYAIAHTLPRDVAA